MRGIERYQEIFSCKRKFMNLIVGESIDMKFNASS